ncbi:MAG: DUF374 domain-containing protein [Smithellaceae bacterium]
MIKKWVKKIRNLATTRAAGEIIYGLVWFYSLTLRLKIENEAAWFDDLKQGGRFLLCAWHQQFFIGVKLFRRYRKYPACVMVSKSLDGEIASRIAEAAGVYAARGSSSRDGGLAMKDMINFVIRHRFGVHLLDGPRGPAGVVKPGAIAIAQGAAAALIPAHVVADRAWHMKSWDRFMIPKPFSRVTVTFHPPYRLEPFRREAEFERQRKKLEDILRPHLLP